MSLKTNDISVRLVLLEQAKSHQYQVAIIIIYTLVRQKGLEPSRPKALAPKASASTNSATAACGDCSICAAKLPPK